MLVEGRKKEKYFNHQEEILYRFFDSSEKWNELYIIKILDTSETQKVIEMLRQCRFQEEHKAS